MKVYQLVLINLTCKLNGSFHFPFLPKPILKWIKSVLERVFSSTMSLNLSRVQVLDGGMGSLIENLGYDINSTEAWGSGFF